MPGAARHHGIEPPHARILRTHTLPAHTCLHIHEVNTHVDDTRCPELLEMAPPRRRGYDIIRIASFLKDNTFFTLLDDAALRKLAIAARYVRVSKGQALDSSVRRVILCVRVFSHVCMHVCYVCEGCARKEAAGWADRQTLQQVFSDRRSSKHSGQTDRQNFKYVSQTDRACRQTFQTLPTIDEHRCSTAGRCRPARAG
jgi:hypothetical protein